MDDPWRSPRRLLSDPPQSSSSVPTGQGSNSSSAGLPVMVSILVAVILGTVCYCIYCWRWRKRNAARTWPPSVLSLTVMDLATVVGATDCFSEANKLGEGGFGPVYRGVLAGGIEVAIKRLSKKSKQGTMEFRNEVELIGKLQHRNLVRLLGYCIEGSEKLLVYEYLSNGSLDTVLFDSCGDTKIDWTARHGVILGIARGLLYLHEDSLLKIVHRDLKASNVLLDNKMNPKISDFGMAQIFRDDDDDQVKIGKVVGTIGYMAPEYALGGVFTIKSDVFSFGVLLLEILSGQRSRSFYQVEHNRSLIQHAWFLWTAGEWAAFMDPLLSDYPEEEACRCVQIGLLCVQEDPDQRPTMSTVVLLLSSDKMQLPAPGEPPSFTRATTSSTSSEKRNVAPRTTMSVNGISITELQPR